MSSSRNAPKTAQVTRASVEGEVNAYSAGNNMKKLVILLSEGSSASIPSLIVSFNSTVQVLL